MSDAFTLVDDFYAWRYYATGQPPPIEHLMEKAKMSSEKVAGYTTQSSKKVNQVNFHKTLEERVLREMDMLARSGCDGPIDARWLAIARTQLEQAFMSLNRSVFQPERISDQELARIRDDRV